MGDPSDRDFEIYSAVVTARERGEVHTAANETPFRLVFSIKEESPYA